MVILCPMCHLGCFKASLLVTCAICSAVNFRNGPPDAVKMIFSIGLSPSPTKHWKIAECSESTGIIGVRYSRARRLMRSPATTNVSLLAKAMVLWASIARIVGFNPEYPTIAVTTISMGAASTISEMAFSPAYIFIGKSFRASFSLL